MSTAAKPGLYANIHAKQERIAHGSGEKMRKPGSAGAPSDKSFAKAAKTKRPAKTAEAAERTKAGKAAKSTRPAKSGKAAEGTKAPKAGKVAKKSRSSR